MATFEEQVLDLTNQERAKNGLSPLQANAELNYTAEKYAKDMSDGHFFSHTGPDGSQPWDREKAAGYEAQVTGENIAVGQTTPQQVVQDWMNSPGHRANILRPQFKDLGVGFNNNYWVQDFGSGDTNPNSYIPSGSNSVASASNSNPTPAPTAAPTSTTTPIPLWATEPVSIPSATKSESTSNQGASPNSNQTNSLLNVFSDKKVNGVFHTNPDNATANGSDFLTGKQGEWQLQYDKGVLASNSFDDILVGGQSGNVDLINNLGTNATINDTLATMDHSQVGNGMVNANTLIAPGDTFSNPSMMYAHASLV